MKGGKLRHRLTLQAPVDTKNEYGETLQTWRDFATGINGSIEPISAREFWRAGQVQADATHGITIRYLPGVLPTMRVVFGARIFNILSAINHEERNIEWQLVCKETL